MPRSATLAAWARAWVDGQASADDLIAAVTGSDPPHEVVAADGTLLGGLGEALRALRASGGPIRVVLPVPGDLRGLPAGEPFRSSAGAAGEAVVAPGLGLVPEEINYFPSSAPPSMRWYLHPVDSAAEDYVSVSDAQHDLAIAIRACTTALTAADVAGSRDDLLTALGSARHAGEHLALPPGHPQRAVALIAQAERLHAVLELALLDPAGGAVDRFEMAARDASLRPLATAVRRARLAGYNA